MDFIEIQEQLKQVERQGYEKAIKALRDSQIDLQDSAFGWAQYLEFKQEDILNGRTDRDKH
jgi:hypothetical protein